MLQAAFSVFRVLLLCLAFSSHAAGPGPVAEAGWIGAEQCRGCHEETYAAWQGSHHDLAMQRADSASVLADFDNRAFSYAGVTSRFFRRGEEYWVNTDGPDGKMRDFRIEFVFGVEPLQQYLLALPGGRLQALGIAWDSRPAEKGGQRWFHLYPQQAIVAGDPLHWSGPYHNWNARCAECHSTNLQKNYDRGSRQYATTWSEINVACESCHGPGALHRRLAQEQALEHHPGAGFPVDLASPVQWQFRLNRAIAEPLAKASSHPQQVENCGRCHARRGTLGSYHYGQPLLDTHRLSLPRPPLYHPDGQILDEVYVYGSFLQSKMFRAGVVCSDCHDPHSLELKAPGNGVCAQCHRADSYDQPAHHHHPAGSSGADCANCHMPATNYMVVDPRRDHSMRIPRPDLSVVMGTPNACNQCHRDRDADWALSALRRWGVRFSDTGEHPAHSFALAGKGDVRAVPGLASLALDSSAAPIRRAAALVELGGFADREAYDAALMLLQSEDPVLRLGAVRALQFLPPQQLLPVLKPLLNDPVTSIRTELARVLAPVQLQQTDPATAAALEALFKQYLMLLGEHADMPETQVQFGIFFTARQLWGPAEQAYRRAIELNPQALPALLNLADLYRVLAREEEARKVLLDALAVAPEQGAPYHALGLLETRAGQPAAALEYLARAAALESAGVRYRYVYAIALHDRGRVNQALTQLKAILRSAPQNPDVLMALASYSRQAGRLEDARRYAARLREFAPQDPAIRRLYDSLR